MKCRAWRQCLGGHGFSPSLLAAAIEEIEKNKGILYEEIAADACLKLFREKGYQLT
jgi:hypothetical protein